MTFVEYEMKEEVVQQVIRDSERHIKKYGHRKMTLKELDKLCEDV